MFEGAWLMARMARVGCGLGCELGCGLASSLLRQLEGHLGVVEQHLVWEGDRVR